MPRVFHILPRVDWQQALQCGSYAPASLSREGFIHCSTSAQVLDTAHRWYRGRPDLLLLEIDVHRLTAPLRHEPPVNSTDERRAQLFPHLYGPLNLDAVAAIFEFPCQPDGSFRLPGA